jgi:hypothetical protein
MATGCMKTSVVDPDLVGSASFCRTGSASMGMPIADPDWHQFQAHVFLTFFS